MRYIITKMVGPGNALSKSEFRQEDKTGGGSYCIFDVDRHQVGKLGTLEVGSIVAVRFDFAMTKYLPYCLFEPRILRRATRIAGSIAS